MSGTIQGSGTTTASGSTGTTAKSTGIAGDFNTFLTLLTTQLKNQDPTNAMDTNEMTNQLVSFASVEQQIALNTSIGRLISLQQNSQLTEVASLIGKTVEVESDQLSLQSGTATLRLPAAGAARTADIQIYNAAGSLLVKVPDVPLDATAKDWTWDGRTGAGTAVLPDGAYRFSISGKDASLQPQSITATVIGTVTSATRQSSGDMQLDLGKLSLSYDAVRRLGSQ